MPTRNPMCFLWFAEKILIQALLVGVSAGEELATVGRAYNNCVGVSKPIVAVNLLLLQVPLESALC